MKPRSSASGHNHLDTLMVTPQPWRTSSNALKYQWYVSLDVSYYPGPMNIRPASEKNIPLTVIPHRHGSSLRKIRHFQFPRVELLHSFVNSFLALNQAPAQAVKVTPSFGVGYRRSVSHIPRYTFLSSFFDTAGPQCCLLLICNSVVVLPSKSWDCKNWGETRWKASQFWYGSASRRNCVNTDVVQGERWSFWDLRGLILEFVEKWSAQNQIALLPSRCQKWQKRKGKNDLL